MFATFNRWIAYALFTLGFAMIAVGAYLGMFAWLNDGALAGLKLLGTAGSFGAALALAGFGFRFAASAHAGKTSRRWWIQVLAPLAGFVLFGMAATASSLLDRIGRP